jgi:enoyl-CoA hydratase
MDQEAVRIEADGEVAVVVLNRGERRNVLDADMVAGLSDAFDQLEQAGETRAVVLTGTGPAFCAGAELETLVRSAHGGFEEVRGVYEGFLRLLRSPLPTVAAVNGPAVGAGLNLALACDVRVASTRATFESRFPQLRLHPGGGHTWLLERAVGRQQATAMALFGRRLDAEQARTAGLVLEVHQPEEVVSAAVELASGVADMEPELVRLVTATLRTAEQEPKHRSVLELETERQQWSTTRPDFVKYTHRLQAAISSRRQSTRQPR